jgi:hypothetical protein
LDQPLPFADAVRALFEPLGGVDLREIPRDPPDFSDPEWDEAE